MRNFGLSGMNSLMMRADERLGMEQRTTNNLQLWKSTKPREKWVQVFGITNQARPANRDTRNTFYMDAGDYCLDDTGHM